MHESAILTPRAKPRDPEPRYTFTPHDYDEDLKVKEDNPLSKA